MYGCVNITCCRQTGVKVVVQTFPKLPKGGNVRKIFQEHPPPHAKPIRTHTHTHTPIHTRTLARTNKRVCPFLVSLPTDVRLVLVHLPDGGDRSGPLERHIQAAPEVQERP